LVFDPALKVRWLASGSGRIKPKLGPDTLLLTYPDRFSVFRRGHYLVRRPIAHFKQLVVFCPAFGRHKKLVALFLWPLKEIYEDLVLYQKNIKKLASLPEELKLFRITEWQNACNQFPYNILSWHRPKIA
jgi:hypothetical protein